MERFKHVQFYSPIAAFLLSDLAELPSALKVSKLILDDRARKEVAVLWTRAKAFNQAIVLAQAIREPDFCCIALKEIAEELLQVGMKEQAGKPLEQAVKVATEGEYKFHEECPMDLASISEVMVKAGMIEQAKQAIEKALDLATDLDEGIRSFV